MDLFPETRSPAETCTLRRFSNPNLPWDICSVQHNSRQAQLTALQKHTRMMATGAEFSDCVG